MPYTIPEYIEIKATDGSTVAFLSPKSDGIKDCWIDDEQNGSCTLEFELPLNNPKWQYLTDQYRIYAGGKEFVILNPDAVDKQRDGKKLKGKVKAHESWVLLGKKYQTISNDPLIGTPPWGAVIIVSGGSDLSNGHYPVGSAGHALYALLQGTGWTVGTVDVPGTYDLETEKESVLYNINQVQEKWGGILIWDSINKTVSLRDEVTYKPYTGFQIRYAKNLKGINRTDDYDIVTRLYPFGENDLNIANVNGGLLYLDNHSYSDDILEGVWYNQDIADQTQLKIAGEKQLAVMCRPRHNYKTEVLDLRSLPGYGHEAFKRSDMVDLLDEDFGTDAQVRIIRYRYNVFQPWLCDMELGDPLEKIAASVAQTVLMAKFYKNVVAPNTSFQNLLKAIINTEATEINGASGDYTLKDGVSTWFDRDPETGELTGKLLRITPQGLIISYDGGQTWKLAISGEGIHADAGWVGKLNAGVITVGPETTFAPGYDPTQIVAGSTVGMGVDADCLGLWHFDGSLNSHKGAAVESNADYNTGLFGQALNIVTGKHLKVPAAGLSASQGTISFRAKNLSESANGSVLVDLPKSDNTQGLIAGIDDEGKIFIEEAKLQFQAIETTQTDFNGGTLVDATATSAGNLELSRQGVDTTYTETSQVDFNSGTLTNVVATSAGDLELVLNPGGSSYGTDFTGSGTYSADSVSTSGSTTFSANKAFDNDESTAWWSSNGAFPHWVMVDLGVGVTKIARKLRIKPVVVVMDARVKNFKLQGSNDNSNWTDIYTGVAANSSSWQEFIFPNSNAYRYYRVYGTSTYDTSIASNIMAITEIEIMEYITLPPTYSPNGTREKTIDISGANPAGGTKIEWLKTTPAGTTVKVETALSTNGGSTYGAWQEPTSGGSIPGITAGTDLSNARLKIRETLSTTDTSRTPQLHSLSIYIYAPYKFSGYRYKEYDISNVGKVGSSRIAWESNVPANTTLTVKAAISTDGGSSYGAWQTCTNGQAIPVLTQGMDISNARLKVQEDLATSDGTKSPQLQSLVIEVSGNTQIGYGPNKSTLTGWDSISLAWKPERLSLVVNDEEACYIENPGLPASLGSHVYIGTDRNGANAINTLVDELRIDKVYREVNIRTGWHKTGVPFYTSEDMKQWPGYMRAETDGLKVYDSSDALRVLVGSWLKDAVRKYGIKIIDGEIYSSLIRSGAEDATTYIQFNPPNSLEVYYGGYLQMLIEAINGGRITFYNNGSMIGRLSGAFSGRDLGLIGINTGNIYIGDNLYVNGNISKAGTYSALEPTLNYGDRLLYAAECPELKYYDSGIVNLQNGDATVHLDQIFLECIEPDTELTPWQIWVQCYGENDVYVAEVGTDYFVIKERNGGTSNNKVIWRFEAIRKNYAGIRLMEVV